MSVKKLRKEAELYFIPFLLGSSKRSHALALKIFRKYGMCSYILDKKLRLLDIIDPISKFSSIYGSEDELICAQLITLAHAEPYTLPILIPIGDEYRRTVETQRDRLERVFVICEPDKVFCDSPIAKFFDTY